MRWQLHSDDPVEREAFASPGSVLNLSGDIINENWMSTLLRVSLGSGHYYVKRYAVRGRGMRRLAGRSRARAEWENLLWFEAQGIPTARVVACGEGRFESGYCGLVVTEERPGTLDLFACAASRKDLLLVPEWRRGVIRRLAGMVRTMHEQGFVHGDLKWRNILVEVDAPSARVFLIDCPQGRKMPEPFLSRGIIKDLACLHKVARYRLSATDQLRFYLAYQGAYTGSRLDETDRKRIRRIVRFFHGDE
ncbi:MAG: heptose kinase [Proteobacteria bacterium]|nr:heptose kinase [Pseudomonadota bacterium]